MAVNESVIRLLPYQKRWLVDDSRFKIGMFSRQAGKTFSATLEIVDRVIEAAERGAVENWVILSRGERQAKEALDEGIKKHLAALNAISKFSEYPWQGAEATHRALEVELNTGSKITALPANPDTARGFSRNVLLDEFAFHQDSRKIWAAVFPVITRNEKLIRIISTPNGKGNKFYDIMQDKSTKWSQHEVNIHDAIRQGLRVDADELKAALGDNEAWAREYELSWLDDSNAWLSFDLIESAVDKSAGDPGSYTGGKCYLGNDIGRTKDLWAAVVLEKVGDVFWLRELATMQGASFAAQDAELDRLIKQYKIQRAAIDQTGIGMKPVEDAQARHGMHRISGVTFTQQTKQAMATLGKRVFEQGKIRISNDPELKEDLGKLRRTMSATGLPRFDATNDSNGHADRTWALFLALSAAEADNHMIDYLSTGTRITADAFERPSINTGSGFGSVPGGHDTRGF